MMAAAWLAAWAPAGAWAADPVEGVLYTATAKSGIQCEVVAVSPAEVEIIRGDKSEKIGVERIDQLSFPAEPDALKDARSALRRGEPDQALEELGRIEAGEFEGLPQLVLDEHEYLKAAAAGGRAVGGGEHLAAGEKAVRDYLAKHAGSHHFFPMQELLATLLARSGKFAAAAEALAPLDRGPPTFRVRAATGRAGLLFDQQKYAEAQREFAAAAQMPTDPQDAASTAQKRSAEVGQARCLGRLGKPAEAVAAINKIIDQSAPTDDGLLGQAYNALGDIHRAAGQDQDAIIAFLTVDLVYNGNEDAHAETLFNLAQLWDARQSPPRAKKARQSLNDLYPASLWAKKTPVTPER
jgi:tetratricopeptide (TPR) repeat protein